MKSLEKTSGNKQVECFTLPQNHKLWENHNEDFPVSVLIPSPFCMCFKVDSFI